MYVKGWSFRIYKKKNNTSEEGKTEMNEMQWMPTTNFFVFECKHKIILICWVVWDETGMRGEQSN